MDKKQLSVTIYKDQHYVYLKSTYFTLKIGNTQIHDPDDLIILEGDTVYPMANEGTASVTTVLREDSEDFTKIGQYNMTIYVNQRTNTGYVQSKTDVLPYEPYYIIVNDQVYEVTNIRVYDSLVDEFLEKEIKEDQKLVTNIVTGVSEFKTKNCIKQQDLALSFSI